MEIKLQPIVMRGINAEVSNHLMGYLSVVWAESQQLSLVTICAIYSYVSGELLAFA
jgi:hypothetical protein